MPGDDITILLPCKDQKREFLSAAIDSVLAQTCPEWKLLVVVNPNTPRKTKQTVLRYCEDPRVKMLISREGLSSGIAGALNTGMKRSKSRFVCVLLSDDRLSSNAIQILKRSIRRHPRVDFFHSSRLFTNSKGRPKSKVLRSIRRFTIEYFKKKGSPVKHLLCWRRTKGIEIGGMDKKLRLHGCDDYDFPWSMAEAGCKFMAIRDCLYYMRIHHEAFRLTTGIALRTQISTLRRMFKKHRVSDEETESYIKWALKTYLIRDQVRTYGK
jgi:glycosyltransferase involved in cell wall biosynthesis